jgi:hypothetical protein
MNLTGDMQRASRESGLRPSSLENVTPLRRLDVVEDQSEHRDETDGDI